MSQTRRSIPKEPEKKSRDRVIIVVAILAVALAIAIAAWQYTKAQPHATAHYQVAPFGKALWMQQQKTRGAGPGGVAPSGGAPAGGQSGG